MNVRSRKHWSRRGALQSLALGSGGLAFSASARKELSLWGGPAAAAMATPKRLLVISSLYGVRHDRRWDDWLAPGPTEADFKLQGMTLPLEKHRSELVFFDNMMFGTTVEWGDTHHVGNVAMLTGAKLVKKDGAAFVGAEEAMPGKCKPVTPSVDFYAGQKIGAIATPQWPSVQFNFQMPSSLGSFVSFDGNGATLPAFRSPWDAYAKLFGNVPDGGAAKEDPALLARMARSRSVVDAVAKDVADFRRRLPPEDRARADAQLEALRTLEARLANGGAAPVAGCARPALSPMVNPNDTTRWPDILRTTSDLVVSAMACDLTRVVMLGWRNGPERPLCNFAPINSNHYEHESSHDFLDEFVRLKTWYMGEVSYILDKLKAIPEGNGTMLDNTIVLWATEISMGHQHGRMPWMTAGGRNLGVNTGRCLKLPTTRQNPFRMRSDKGYPHVHLLVSICNALGLPDASFGDREVGTGPMPGFLRA